MTEPPRPAARALGRGVAMAALTALFIGVAACGSSASPTTGHATSLTEPSLTPVPGAPSATPPATRGPVATTDIAGFGPILDVLPSSFPRLTGQVPADTGAGPTSGTFAVKLDADAASAAIRTGLEHQGWSVDSGSPLEDGTIVLEATGPTAGCKAEVRFTPQGGTLMMSVLYGASCPAA